MKRFYITILVLLFVACGKDKNEGTDTEPVVKVFDNVLYLQDIKNIIPAGTSPEDSANIAETYINNWIQRQIMLHYANELLKDQLGNIDEKTAEFKDYLLIHEFKKRLIEVNADTSVSISDLESYYSTHKNEFKLKENLIKGFFLRLPLETEGLNEFKKMLHNYTEDNLNEIIDFVKSNNAVIDDFTHKWKNFSTIVMKMPVAVEDVNHFINRNGIEATDSLYYYYLRITDRKTEGETAPFEYVKDDIAKILLQKQNDAIVKKFMQKKYNEAIKSGKIEYFK